MHLCMCHGERQESAREWVLATTGALWCVTKKKPKRTHMQQATSFAGWWMLGANASWGPLLLASPLRKKKIHIHRTASSLGGTYNSFVLAPHWRPAGRHWGATVHCASVTNQGESEPISRERKKTQPPVLIKNAVALNAYINLSTLCLARVALCTAYEIQQLKQVVWASSRCSWMCRIRNVATFQYGVQSMHGFNLFPAW